MLCIRSRTACIGLLVAVCVCAPAQAQTTLRYRFKEGEKLNYLLEQKMKMKMTIQGRDITMDMTQTVNLSWNIQSVDKDGTAKMTQKFDRTRLSLNGPGVQFDYDSKDGKVPEGRIGMAMGPMLKAMGGLEITLTMDSSGRMKDVKVPDDFAKAVKQAGGGAGLGDLFSGESLQRMISQAGLVLPKEPVSRGKTWEQKVELKMPFGKMNTTNTLTYDGSVTRGGKTLEVIRLKPVIKIEADPKAPATLDLKSQDAKGTGYFDAKAGRLAETTLNQKMEMEINAGGQTITQNIQQDVSLKLQDGK
jgi:hypothetical protein